MDGNNKIIGKFNMSFTDEYGETTSLKKTYSEEVYSDYDPSFGSITFLLEEFKYFLKSMGFCKSMIDRIVYLEPMEKVINENGDIIYDQTKY